MAENEPEHASDGDNNDRAEPAGGKAKQKGTTNSKGTGKGAAKGRGGSTGGRKAKGGQSGGGQSGGGQSGGGRSGRTRGGKGRQRRRRPPEPGPVSSGPSFPEERFRVQALVDPVIDALGHDPRSLYVEQFWVCSLGPSVSLVLRRLAAGLEEHPSGFEVDVIEFAQELGIGHRGGRNSPLWRALDRAGYFGLVRRNGPVVVMRRYLPPLTARQIERLPDHLRRAHQNWMSRQLASGPGPHTSQTKPSPCRRAS